MTQSTSDPVSEKSLAKPDALARRTRLREFQAQLLERMQAARTGASPYARQLGVLIGQRYCLLNLQEAGEIISVGAITAVPLTQDWFLGLTNVRGSLVSVIDLARFQGQAGTSIDRESRVVVFAPGLSFNSGILVSRVLGLRNVDDMRPHENEAEATASWAVRQYVDRDAQVWTELDLSLIVQDAQFLHVGL
ncbi:chemotaxis protein CheW [Janthinobacterium sp. 17J80-10]|uniref:chemotaxis protein CheW n=1 Tax=Janthinobacterium sp. 17J80-10 TaxID=2497863 RepID=UPI001005407F|nr:chemotaxis protein CheW [Janthinobacterium sp. 17J80-10]QAU33544.1 chemotaxis protein CheW [Janthinobacterium sp. 17J80-10]